MGDTLNFVFDDWKEGEDEPSPNSESYFNGCGSVGVDNIMSYYYYTNYKKYRIEDVYKYPDKKFYYLVWNVITGDDILFKKESFPVNNNVIEYLKENENLYLIALTQEEASGVGMINKIEKFCSHYNINPKQIWNINNNLKLKDLKKYFNININLHSSKTQSLTVKKRNFNFDIKQKKESPSLFLCLNNTLKEHRVALLILMMKYNILKDTNWSLIQGSFEYNTIKTFGLFDEIDIDTLKNEMKNISKIKCKKSDFEQNVVYNEIEDVDWESEISKTTLENSYINITTESFFNERDIHITEKSFKPISYYQIPLILGSHHHVKYLRENYDFDLFDDIIDYSYDNVVDNGNRIFKFVEEVKRIQENKDFFIKFYEENQDRFLENHRKYDEINNQYDIDFFDSLI